MANLLSDAVTASPGKRALDDGHATYSYLELERLSDNFAAYLLSGGLRTGDRVAFCAAKSGQLIAAILGCLKAGGIYVPVDENLPRDRLLFVLSDVMPRFIVCSRMLFASIRGELDLSVRQIDAGSLEEHCRGREGSASLPAIDPDDGAYCLYTSGSTGRPKGVLIHHGAVAAFFEALAEVMPIDADSRCMNTSALYFDVHVMDLFFPLYRGATVYLTSGPAVGDTLLQTIEDKRITHFTAVGPVMTVMAEARRFERCDLSSVGRIMTGAEIINVGTMQKWLRKIPGLSIVNGYGPTEVTVICTAYIIDRIEPGRDEFYPIGTPMRASRLLLLLEDGRMTSEPGVKGELLIGGPQVMQGYWNNDQLTAQRIMTIAGERYYRSGDICSWLPDGNLAYHGRNDEEIKLSGFRINLNEIKRVMDAEPSVREGFPIVVDDTALGKVIGACFTSTEPGSTDSRLFDRLHKMFKDVLPYYMVPSLYFLFDEFPVLPSGKTDKNRIVKQAKERLSASAVGTTRFVCCEVDQQKVVPT
ncbi:MAG TPA: amino acid adenylation domain-containing protein [Streptosporangiaceae bacterium]|nr:amino acid adenylation domain-containing protein [Streptosporangiaceae bacterium]